MTIKITFQYEKNQDKLDPKILVNVYVPAFLCLKLFVYSFLGRPQLLWHTLSPAEIESLLSFILDWRLVRKRKNKRKV